MLNALEDLLTDNSGLLLEEMSAHQHHCHWAIAGVTGPA
jgi:hypothetical protein